MQPASSRPQSIHSAAQKGQPCPDKLVPHVDDNVAADSNDDTGKGMISGGCDGDPAVRASNEPIKARVSKLHIQESSWHEAILLKEDSKNLNWLNSMEDECDQSHFLS